ncbi:MAG: L-arabinose isomerase [Chitinophagaceae bacterium]|nr:L-arabinose isomerase [Chitinophagaceae bacterium]
MIDLKSHEVWFVTGSQHLYGEETLKKVAEHSKTIAEALNNEKAMPVRILFKEVVTTPDEIINICREANNSRHCIGVITWMHTFSPAKMWIGGLKILQKPLAHLHTQFNRDIPWDKIDMDFMNLNQSAHGDREFGFMVSRMRKNRKVIVGHWQDTEVIKQLGDWTRVAAAWYTMLGARVVRFGDNMRHVAVTEGDKVEAQMVFGYSVNTHGIGDLVKVINEVAEKETDLLIQEYFDTYTIKGIEKTNSSLRDAAKIELGLLQFMQENNFVAFTDTFEDLHGMNQLPGIAAQRLMEKGFGFAGEGDWKTAALVRMMKVMATGLEGGNSFMEDYTYHFDPKDPQVLGAHMLEICPSIAKGKPKLEIHPLGIGGKADPARLVFDGASGPAINVSIIDMGNRFRIIVNEVEAVEPKEELPKLPVARVLWKPVPDMKTACHAWILAGGAHHTAYSQNIGSGMIEDFAEIADVEYLLIGKEFNMHQFKNELRWNECAHR